MVEREIHKCLENNFFVIVICKIVFIYSIRPLGKYINRQALCGFFWTEIAVPVHRYSVETQHTVLCAPGFGSM